MPASVDTWIVSAEVWNRMKKIIERLKQFNLDRDWGQFHTPSNLSKSIAIEAAELLECFQWDDQADLEKVEDELADVFMYALMMAYTLDIDIEAIISKKLDRNEARYPITKAKGNSRKYTELSDEDHSGEL